MPESMHMIMWAMSDRAIPRSLRMMEGFGVHTFRLVNAQGESTFVKFHWRPEARRAVGGVGRGGEDRRRRSRLPSPRPVRGDRERRLPGVGVVPADLRPGDRRQLRLRRARRDQADSRGGHPAAADRPDGAGPQSATTSSPRPSRSRSVPANVVPGIDFTNDPLLQGRLFSYLDTQLSGWAGPNFHQIPINAPKCPFHNFQRDGHMQMAVPQGPRELRAQLARARQAPRANARARLHDASLSRRRGAKLRLRPESFADHYTPGAAVLPPMTPTRAGPHRERAGLRAQQGRDHGDPHPHARPSRPDRSRRSASAWPRA